MESDRPQDSSAARLSQGSIIDRTTEWVWEIQAEWRDSYPWKSSYDESLGTKWKESYVKRWSRWMRARNLEVSFSVPFYLSRRCFNSSSHSQINCRAGIWSHTRRGDLIQNIAIAEFANEGKLISDGQYLRDLQYDRHDRVGRLPSWLDSLKFPPDYFHRAVVSTGEPVINVCLHAFVDQVEQSITLHSDQVSCASSHSLRNQRN